MFNKPVVRKKKYNILGVQTRWDFFSPGGPPYGEGSDESPGLFSWRLSVETNGVVPKHKSV